MHEIALRLIAELPASQQDPLTPAAPQHLFRAALRLHAIHARACEAVGATPPEGR